MVPGLPAPRRAKLNRQRAPPPPAGPSPPVQHLPVAKNTGRGGLPEVAVLPGGHTALGKGTGHHLCGTAVAVAGLPQQVGEPDRPPGVPRASPQVGVQHLGVRVRRREGPAEATDAPLPGADHFKQLLRHGRCIPEALQGSLSDGNVEAGSGVFVRSLLLRGAWPRVDLHAERLQFLGDLVRGESSGTHIAGGVPAARQSTELPLNQGGKLVVVILHKCDQFPSPGISALKFQQSILK
mmetsp:Transcript_59050/g.136181  ORF Transcript_59050/g.136181 Transcript_59050/m.136181 type:complete len:238 (-) Transcript_59050:1292-2005(-)